MMKLTANGQVNYCLRVHGSPSHQMLLLQTFVGLFVINKAIVKSNRPVNMLCLAMSNNVFSVIICAPFTVGSSLRQVNIQY